MPMWQCVITNEYTELEIMSLSLVITLCRAETSFLCDLQRNGDRDSQSSVPWF